VEAASDDVLRLAAGLERQSAHPIARAIVAEAGRRKIPLPATRAVVERAGWGVAGEVDGRRLSVETSGPNRVRVVEAGRTLGEITLRDRIRAGAREAIAALGARGVEVQIASGDRAEAVASVARELGVASAEGGLDPQAKRERVRALRDAGRRVCFVGDGVNDGVAITEADVGIAMGTGSAVSVHAADGVLVEGAAPGGEVLRALAAGIGVARDEARTVRRISLRALLYNVVAVAAAAAGLVNPLIAALSMPLSSLMVVASAVRVGRRA
jgi:P-type E1-E2 ATPase